MFYSDLQSQTPETAAPNTGNTFWVHSSPVGEVCITELAQKATLSVLSSAETLEHFTEIPIFSYPLPVGSLR